MFRNLEKNVKTFRNTEGPLRNDGSQVLKTNVKNPNENDTVLWSIRLNIFGARSRLSSESYSPTKGSRSRLQSESNSPRKEKRSKSVFVAKSGQNGTPPKPPTTLDLPTTNSQSNLQQNASGRTSKMSTMSTGMKKNKSSSNSLVPCTGPGHLDDYIKYVKEGTYLCL